MQLKVFFIIYIVAVAIVASTSLLVGVYARESLELISCRFYQNMICDIIAVEVRNAGTFDVTPKEVIMNGKVALKDPTGLYPILAGSTQIISFLYDWISEFPYRIQIVTTKGNVFSKTFTSPEKQPPLMVEMTFWNCTANTTSIVVRNVGTISRNITELRIDERPPAGWVVTKYTNIGTGIIVQPDQLTTIILYWPNVCKSWDSLRTYYFTIQPTTEPVTIFNSKAPPP